MKSYLQPDGLISKMTNEQILNSGNLNLELSKYNLITRSLMRSNLRTTAKELGLSERALSSYIINHY